MKLGIFTDSHYSSADVTCGRRLNSRSLVKIKEACARFAAEGCDLILCLGDLTDTEESFEKECENLAACGEAMNAAGEIPVLCVMGNHDAFVFTPQDFYCILGEHRRPPRVLPMGDVTLLFIDACHFSDGRHYMPGDSDWEDTFYPYTDALAADLAAVRGDAYLILHQSLDAEISEDHRLSNDAEIRAILEEIGVVRGVIQGHYHPGAQHTAGGIDYLTLRALCENDTDDAIRILQL